MNQVHNHLIYIRKEALFQWVFRQN